MELLIVSLASLLAGFVEMEDLDFLSIELSLPFYVL